MTFDEYLRKTNTSVARFAKTIDVSPATVTKWKYNGVIPRKQDVIKIHEITKGQVSPNDFYGVPR